MAKNQGLGDDAPAVRQRITLERVTLDGDREDTAVWDNAKVHLTDNGDIMIEGWADTGGQSMAVLRAAGSWKSVVIEEVPDGTVDDE